MNTASCSAILENIFVLIVGHIFQLLGCERLDPTRYGFPIERPRKYLIIAMSIACLSWFKSKLECEVYMEYFAILNVDFATKVNHHLWRVLPANILHNRLGWNVFVSQHVRVNRSSRRMYWIVFRTSWAQGCTLWCLVDSLLKFD